MADKTYRICELAFPDGQGSEWRPVGQGWNNLNRRDALESIPEYVALRNCLQSLADTDSVMRDWDTARDLLASLKPSGEAVSTAGESIFAGLTEAQAQFMAAVVAPISVRAEIAEYLRSRAAVRIYRQIDVLEEPPFALDVDSNPGFWIGCFESHAAAVAAAAELGLPVLDD